MLLGREPALVLGLIQAVIALAIGFGLDISPEQFGLIMAASAAAASVIVRAQVTPVIDPKVDGSPVVDE